VRTLGATIVLSAIRIGETVTASVEDIAGYVKAIKDWQEEYKINEDVYVLEELTLEQIDELRELDKKGLVWTQHGTCESEMVSFGFNIFGDHALTRSKSSGCGCYQTYCFYVGEEAGSVDYISMGAYEPCPACNEDGEGDGVENCPGPDEVEGASFSDCQDGWINWYFD
jgi:hypothetical protein